MADKILATLTSKGQITVPADIARRWGLKPGDQIALRSAGRKVGPPRAARSEHLRALDELKLPSLGRPLTQQDIDEAITTR